MNKRLHLFRLPILVVLAVCGSLLGCTTVVGQQASPSDGFDSVIKFEGKLKNFQRGVVHVTRDDDTEVMVHPSEDVSAFEFQASATADFLKRGARIRFTGTFNQAGLPMTPVTQVDLFQVVVGKVPANVRQDFIPGIYPVDADRPPPTSGVAEYKVVGGVLALDAAGNLLVQAGNRHVRARLAADCQFDIRYNNLSLARPGDAVSVAGFFQPPDETRVKADRITVTADRVYSASGATAAGSLRRGRRPTRGPTSGKDSNASDQASKESGGATPES